jgi:hypothetical protein
MVKEYLCYCQQRLRENLKLFLNCLCNNSLFLILYTSRSIIKIMLLALESMTNDRKEFAGCLQAGFVI